MGKMIIAQRKGKVASPNYRSPGHRFFGDIRYEKELHDLTTPLRGQVVEFVDDPGRGPILAQILLENGLVLYNIAPEGMILGSSIHVGPNPTAHEAGAIVKLKDLQDGTPIYNVELNPRDGGKLARSSGAVAYVVSKDEDKNTVDIRLASRAVKRLSGECLATIGIACGGGHTEKPFKKASNKMWAMLARGREWPHTRRGAMSAYNHPFGGRSFGKPTSVSRNTPPGRKVGHIASSRTGRKRCRQSNNASDQKK